MTYRGHINNGVVVLDEPTDLSEGDEVSVHLASRIHSAASPEEQPSTLYEQLEGVTHVASGYTGGTVAHRSYEQVCAGTTGHAEAVRIAYDPQVISLGELLAVFFDLHDPTTLNRQGADVGTQYRSAIYTHDEAQKETAEQVIRELGAARKWPGPIVTEVTPAGVFYVAEDYHQEYFRNNKGQPYCRAVIAPKVKKFEKLYLTQLKI